MGMAERSLKISRIAAKFWDADRLAKAQLTQRCSYRQQDAVSGSSRRARLPAISFDTNPALGFPEGHELDAARLRAAIAGRSDIEAPSGASASQIETHRQFLIAQSAELNGKLSGIDCQTAQRQAERASVEAGIDKLQATIPVARERVDLRKYLLGKELTSKLVYLTEYQDFVGMQQDLAVEQTKLREADAAIATLKETRTRIAAESRRSLFDDLAKADQKAAWIKRPPPPPARALPARRSKTFTRAPQRAASR